MPAWSARLVNAVRTKRCRSSRAVKYSEESPCSPARRRAPRYLQRRQPSRTARVRGEAESIILIEYSAPGTNLALANRDTSSLPALHLPALLAQVPPHSQFTRRATALWRHIGSGRGRWMGWVLVPVKGAKNSDRALMVGTWLPAETSRSWRA